MLTWLERRDPRQHHNDPRHSLPQIRLCFNDEPVLCYTAGQEFATVAHNAIINIDSMSLRWIEIDGNLGDDDVGDYGNDGHAGSAS